MTVRDNPGPTSITGATVQYAVRTRHKVNASIKNSCARSGPLQDELFDWIKETLIGFETISQKDLEYISIADDPMEVLEISNKHRHWKEQQRQLANKGPQ